MKKGKLPITEKIELQSTKDQWLMLNRKIINYLDCTALVQRNMDSRVRIKLRLVNIFKPSDYGQNAIVECTGAHKEIQGGLERMNEFFVNWYRESQWMMFGFIMGENPIPIIIMHVECFNVSIYTTKFDRDQFKDLIPEGVHLN